MPVLRYITFNIICKNKSYYIIAQILITFKWTICKYLSSLRETNRKQSTLSCVSRFNILYIYLQFAFKISKRSINRSLLRYPRRN